MLAWLLVLTLGMQHCYMDGYWVSHKRNVTYNIQTCGGRKVPSAMKQTNVYQYEWVVNKCTPKYTHLQKTEMLAKIRNEWLTFIGDSLSRNFYYALVCLLYDEPYQTRRVAHYDEVRYYTAYNATVARMWSTFLVMPDLHLRSVKQYWPHPVPELGVDITISKGIQNTTIMVLGTGGWWGEGYRPVFKAAITVVLEYLQSFSGVVVFQLQGRTQHYPCFNRTTPLEQISDTVPRDYDTFRGVLDVLETRYKTVRFLRTEKISEYRIDSHPSSVITYKSKKKDCQHWILPGVPDTWTQLLFNYML